MTEAEFIETVYEQWESGWEDLHSADPSDPSHVPFTFKSEAFSTDQLGELGAWIRISIIHTAAEQTTSGTAPNRKFERRGNVWAQLFAPQGSGVGLLATLAGDVRTVLEGMRLGEANLYAGDTREGSDEPTWATSTVVIPFRYTETR